MASSLKRSAAAQNANDDDEDGSLPKRCKSRLGDQGEEEDQPTGMRRVKIEVEDDGEPEIIRSQSDRENQNHTSTKRPKIAQQADGYSQRQTPIFPSQSVARFSMSTFGTSRPRDHRQAGRIAALSIENFMCHKSLEVNFQPDKANCFYIGGPNGSGKSAVFAALHIGLGGTGRENERGSSLSGYVKDGEATARIRIWLTNEGTGRDERFGRFVLVERILRASSAGTSLAIRASNDALVDPGGKSIGSRASDMMRLLARFDISIRNHIFWMSQDRCRQFLQDMHPESLHRLFTESTDLVAVEELYGNVGVQLSTLRQRLDMTAERMLAMKKQFNRCKIMLEKIRLVKEDAQELDTLRWLLLWAPMRDTAQELERFNQLSESRKKNIADLKERLDQVSEKSEQVAARLKQLDEKDKPDQEERERRQNVEAEAAKLVEKRKHKVHTLRKEAERTSEEIAKQEALKVKITEQMRNMNGGGKTEAERRAAELDADVERCKQTLDDRCRDAKIARDEVAETCHRKEKAISARTAAFKELNEQKYREEQLRHEVERCQRQCVTLEAAKQNRFARFGGEYPHLMKLLQEQQHVFQQQPVGPIGEHMRLRDAQWAQVAEKQFGRSLAGAFIVGSGADERQLKRLFMLAGFHSQFRPNVYIVRNLNERCYDVSRDRPNTQYPTLLEMFDTSHPAVYNKLVDVSRAHRTLCIPADEEARSVMNGRAPYGCRMTVTQSGAEVYPRFQDGTGIYRFYAPDPNFNRIVTRIFAPDQGAASTTDPRVELETARKNLGDVQAQSAEFERKYREACKQADMASTEHGRAQQRVSVSEQDCVCAKQSLERAKRLYDSHLKTSMGIVDQVQLNGMIEQVDADSSKYSDQLEKQESEIIAATEALRRAEDQYDVARSELESFIKQLDPRMMEMRQLKKEKESLDRQSQNISIRLQKTKEDLERHKDKWGPLNSQHEEAKAESERAHKDSNLKRPRGCTVPPDFTDERFGRNAKELREKVDHIERAVEEAQNGMLDEATCRAEAESARNRHRSIKVVALLVESLHNSFAERYRLRRDNLRVIRETMQRCMQDEFRRLMERRRYNAELVFWTDTNTAATAERQRGRQTIRPSQLQIKINSGGRQVRDIRELSGGERSYTTACLIMALWKVCEAPFRLMDEFDVFMDLQNRKEVMNELVRQAIEEYADSQFIFFTPQGVRELRTDTRVALFEMPRVRQ